MKLVFRIVTMLVIAASFLGGTGLAAWEVTRNPWWALGVILAVALALSKFVDEVLGIGVFFGRRQAERETPTPEEHIRSMMDALRQRGIGVASDDEHDEHEEQIVARLKEVADTITDPDLKEFAFHFAHIATDCPGAAVHAARMHELVPFIDARLRASTVAPQNDDDRPQVH